MGRAPCCDRMGLKKGPWTPEEDRILISFINRHGHGNWRALPKQAGLLRCGKSCRLRWTNYLRPDIKRGNFSPDEENTIIELHERLGNKWSVIASHLPGRTDNEIKNVWNTHLKKRVPQKTQQDFPNHINSGISDIMSKFLHASNTSVSDSAKPESTTTTNENSSTETCSSNASSSHSQFDPCHITIEENTAYPSMASPSMGSACSSLSNLDDALHIPQDADMMNSWLPEIIEHNTYHEEFSNIHNNGDSENVDSWIQMLSELGPSPVFPISDGHSDDANFWF